MLKQESISFEKMGDLQRRMFYDTHFMIYK